MINKKIYGLTGMSGAGKSTVCDSFENAGFLIIDCDRLAREVVRKGRPCLDKLHRLFGDSVITKDGELDRRAMGNIVFSHSDKLALAQQYDISLHNLRGYLGNVRLYG